MKIDLSNPVVRELVEHFSAGMKKFRDQIKKLKNNNKSLQSELLHTRCVALDMIMEAKKCSYEEAERFLNKRMGHRFPNQYPNASVN
jgi:hypothetical protein